MSLQRWKIANWISSLTKTPSLRVPQYPLHARASPHRPSLSMMWWKLSVLHVVLLASGPCPRCSGSRHLGCGALCV
jgi:hypothetical protein